MEFNENMKSNNKDETRGSAYGHRMSSNSETSYSSNSISQNNKTPNTKSSFTKKSAAELHEE